MHIDAHTCTSNPARLARVPSPFTLGRIDPTDAMSLARHFDRLSANPFVCFADNGEDNEGDLGGGDNDDTGRSFTQAEVERMIKREVGKVTARYKREIESLSATAEKAAELQQQIEDLQNARAGAGNDDAAAAAKRLERELSKLQGELQSLSKERDAAKAQAEQYSSELRQNLVRDSLTKALLDQGANPKTVAQAVQLMALDAEVVEDPDTGKRSVVVKADGFDTDDLAKASKSWLGSNAHFVKAPSGGAGTPPPNAGGARIAFDDASLAAATKDPGALIEAGLRAVENG